MSDPESSNNSALGPSYSVGEPVRVYVDSDSGAVPEDDWQYRSYRKDINHEVAAKNPPDGGKTLYAETPKEIFDKWQREKVADKAGRLITEEAVQAPPEVEEIIEADEENESVGAVWHNGSSDIPLKIIGSLGYGPDGREYLKVEGYGAGIPKDEVEFLSKPQAHTLKTPDANEDTREAKQVAQSWGEFGENGEYILNQSPDEIARIINVPALVIQEAAAKGFPPEYLMSARENAFTANRLRAAGIDWGAEEHESADIDEIHSDSQVPPPPPGGKKIEDLTPGEREQYKRDLEAFDARTNGVKDPIYELAAKGTRRRLEVQEIADRIEENPKGLKRELRRPGELPLQLQRILGYQVGHLLLARAIHRKEVKERKEKKLGRTHEDGLLGLGIPRTRRHLEEIRRLDEEIRVLRNKLRPFNVYEFRGEDKKAARRDLAELIHRAKRSQIALGQKEPHHEEVYVHKPFKEELDAFNKLKK